MGGTGNNVTLLSESERDAASLNRNALIEAACHLYLSYELKPLLFTS